MAIRKTAGSKARRVPLPADAEPEADSSQPGSAQSPGTGQSSNPGLDKQAASGAGNEEGAKEIIRAEQLEALGKLSAIFGRRAQNIAGEFTAEAPQGPQQLKPPTNNVTRLTRTFMPRPGRSACSLSRIRRAVFRTGQEGGCAGQGSPRGDCFYPWIPGSEIKQRERCFRIKVNVGRELVGLAKSNRGAYAECAWSTGRP